MQKAVVIVAGGSGTRMGGEIPKQFILLAGKPILMHTIERFYFFDETIDIVVVLPENQIQYWKNLCEQYSFNISHQIAFGGTERFFSVKNGLDLVASDCLVGIHDGVRPLVSYQTLALAYNMAEQNGSAIPVIDVYESIRELTEDKSMSSAKDRARYRLVQTPQVFNTNMLKAAYQQSFDSLFTDDASVFERAGYQVFLTQGNRENIKVTTPIDITIAEALIRVLE